MLLSQVEKSYAIPFPMFNHEYGLQTKTN
jgi:hypothetical protein